MKETVDYIKYHGVITSVRNNVDKDYIWFDICQKDEYKDKNPTRAFVIYQIPIKDIIYEVKFYRDTRSNNGFYTNQWIDPKYLTKFLIYDFVR